MDNFLAGLICGGLSGWLGMGFAWYSHNKRTNKMFNKMIKFLLLKDLISIKDLTDSLEKVYQKPKKPDLMVVKNDD